MPVESTLFLAPCARHEKLKASSVIGVGANSGEKGKWNEANPGYARKLPRPRRDPGPTATSHASRAEHEHQFAVEWKEASPEAVAPRLGKRDDSFRANEVYAPNRRAKATRVSTFKDLEKDRVPR
ncbi:MAG: hypothetical protein L6R37_004247 [Teloschistes peruensis]|nr:MAG: hypothetical protein L6R37_004247 [Teloschistes peruensis]